MGFSTSAVIVIFAASVIYMASIFYPVADMSHRNILEAEKMSNELWKEKMNTKIFITDWAGNTLTVYNNGSVALNSSKINVILDGELKPSSSYVVNPGGVWSPKTSINVNIGVASGRVKIIAANGAADYIMT
jgi:archaellum component FlaF (FlaF/FlaG flagellin family)